MYSATCDAKYTRCGGTKTSDGEKNHIKRGFESIT